MPSTNVQKLQEQNKKEFDRLEEKRDELEKQQEYLEEHLTKMEELCNSEASKNNKHASESGGSASEAASAEVAPSDKDDTQSQLPENGEQPKEDSKLEDYEIYLSESIYTDFVLTWTRGTTFEIITSTVLCLACIFVQFMFIATVAGIAKNEVSEQEKSMLNWGLAFYNSTTKSYTETVIDNHSLDQYCDGSAWTWEAQAIEELQEYLEPHWLCFYANMVWENMLSVRNGIFLGSLAVILWAGCCVKEFRLIVEFVSLLSLENRDEGFHFDENENEAKLTSLGDRPRVAIILLATCRIVMLAQLGWYGCRFLIFTTSLLDFILNAAALTFISDIDNLCFEFLAPAKQKAVRSLQPPVMSNKTGDFFRRYGTYTEIGSALLISVIAGWSIVMMQEFSKELKQAGWYLCDNLFYANLDKAVRATLHAPDTDNK